MRAHPPPARACVRPRVLRVLSGRREPVDACPRLFEEELRALLDGGARGTVLLAGGPGDGVTTALLDAARAFDGDPRVRFEDRGERVAGPDSAPLRVVGGGWTLELEADVVLRIAPWTDDDLIEYVLSTRPERCASVQARLVPERWRARMGGRPALWAPVLDVLVERDDVPDLPSALRAVIERDVRGRKLDRLRRDAFAVVTEAELHPDTRPYHARLRRFVDVEAVRRILAVDELLDRIRERSVIARATVSNLSTLLDDTAAELAREATSVERLVALLDDGDVPAGLVASLMHRVAPQELVLPIQEACRSGTRLRLDDASLRRVLWHDSFLEGLHAPGADLQRADLSRCGLKGAVLSRARLAGASLIAADLRVSHLRNADLSGADLTAADLRGATLTGARLCGAVLAAANLEKADLLEARLGQDGVDLTGAELRGAMLDKLDLRRARIEGAGLSWASLRHARLENLQASGVDLRHANLDGALLTGSRLRGAQLSEANLGNAGLAEIDWEDADLEGADLAHASFHLGSSRSGIVPGGYPSQGTRTGFYTEDGRDLTHRAPEEIRKANLCGARLAGARVLDTDFYLVDLRGAEYDAEQEAHFRRTGAILGPRP